MLLLLRVSFEKFRRASPSNSLLCGVPARAENILKRLIMLSVEVLFKYLNLILSRQSSYRKIAENFDNSRTAHLVLSQGTVLPVIMSLRYFRHREFVRRS